MPLSSATTRIESYLCWSPNWSAADCAFGWAQPNTATPDPSVIETCVQALRHLAGYAFDVGILDDGRTAVVEVNEGFSLGTYGVEPTAIADALIARWQQLASPD